VLSAIRQYPWDRMNGQTPLSAATMAGLRQELNFGVWNGSGGLYGTRAQVNEAARLLKRALKGKASRLQVLDDRLLHLAGRFAKPWGWLTGWDISRAIELAKPVMNLMRGVPSQHAMRSVYWRKRTPPPATPDPDHDACGLLWCGAVAPATAAAVREMNECAAALLLSSGFEPAISMTYLSERAVTSVISICYDRDLPGEDQRALNCYGNLVATLESRGYLPYRLGVQSMATMSCGSAYETALRNLKDALDPNGVLAPARYAVPATPHQTGS
ncbi:MAG: FAD-binding oxidoreductase, partial [Bryobacterales bacterium]|nr:FAD-binding oxidoreductase [Bryobacterales bacterium]